jgi:hypothetical protein
MNIRRPHTFGRGGAAAATSSLLREQRRCWLSPHPSIERRGSWRGRRAKVGDGESEGEGGGGDGGGGRRVNERTSTVDVVDV